jgi:hypothetical protein
MIDTSVAVEIAHSGIPSSLASRQANAPTWPSGSGLLSEHLTWAPTLVVTPRRETVFLTRSQQRIMNNALRDSLRIIA